jgi:Sperm-tail PG-rich repeat
LVDCFFILAPGAYKPEQAKIDHTPAFSFGVKTKHEKVSETPAPGVYKTEIVKYSQTPSYSFGMKTVYDKSSSETPAPGHYQPEKAKLDHTPAYSFGVKHNVEQSWSTPGKFVKFFLLLLMVKTLQNFPL